MGWEEAEELPLPAEVFSPSQHSQTSEPRKEFSLLPGGSLLEEWFDLVCKIKMVLYLLAWTQQKFYENNNLQGVVVLYFFAWARLNSDSCKLLCKYVARRTKFRGILIVMNCKWNVLEGNLLIAVENLSDWTNILGKYSQFFPSCFGYFFFFLSIVWSYISGL